MRKFPFFQRGPKENFRFKIFSVIQNDMPIYATLIQNKILKRCPFFSLFTWKIRVCVKSLLIMVWEIAIPTVRKPTKIFINNTLTAPFLNLN